MRSADSYRGIRFALLLASSLCWSVAAFGQDVQSMPEREGRDLVTTQCTACHALSTVLVKRASHDMWEETVTRMVTVYMASINDTDRKTIVAYLSSNYGEGSSYIPGQQMLAEQCFRCHGDGMWKGLKTDRNGWLSVVYRMVGQGGIWTPEQITAIADYLSATYPAGASE